MTPEINNYIIKNYKELQKICNKITNNSSWSGDLLNDVLIQLYDRKEIKLKSLEENQIKYYLLDLRFIMERDQMRVNFQLVI